MQYSYYFEYRLRTEQITNPNGWWITKISVVIGNLNAETFTDLTIKKNS